MLFTYLFCISLVEKTPLYLDPSAPINDRIQDLMDRMAIEEIVGQLQQVDGHFDFIGPMKDQHPGSMFSLLGFTAGHVIELARESRLKIPVLMGIDAIHGHAFYSGGTVFPTQLGVAQSWDEELIESQGNVTAFEIRYTGPSWTFSPVLCISRDARWGRVGETFGEDPFLIGKFATALIKGLQGPDGVTNDPNKVAACAKHFVGYSETRGGRDSTEADLSYRKLQSYFLPPFEKAVKEAKVATFMSGYHAIDGTPMTLNDFLLNDVLRGKWGFDGFVVTDYSNIGYLISNQYIFDNYVDASAAAVKSGNDMSMAVTDFYQAALDAVTSGKLDMEFVNQSCRRILELKFKLGLFEDDRYPDANKAAERNGSPENRQVALQACRESIVMLKNDGFLPLNPTNIQKLAVIGPNADNPLSQNGDWSLGTGQVDFFGKHPRNCTITYVDGFTNRLKEANVTVKYALGCGIEPGEKADLEEAIKIVEDSDVTVVVVGDRLVYYGEMRSTGTLELMGGQLELLRRIIETKKKFIIVLMSYKPLIIPDDIIEHASAVLLQFSPGMMGGQALAEAVFGDFSPNGRLTISIPRHAGQIPVYYNKVRFSHQNNYVDLSTTPRFAFGYGLGYSEIEYIDAKINKNEFQKDEVIKISVVLRNTGKFDQYEVVQAYLHDILTSMTWADIELKGYSRVLVKAGEEIETTIEIPVNECSIVNAKGERVVEPGDFQVRIGKASDNIIFTLDFNVKDE
ncbi:glycosyl hydrolase [Tritrichomonas foetus]|uniref:beta-glucosidase n=1 Tax=Tritrichomonas foetus TaxID=1144522 RepID=A0A1J4JGT0_9EUKA|nr:glycosyl hydrolase [Tritrichomonas foetus]|eukprot:OHS96444.1 glycosyl hydrolase [Tritrichomonas foetus]